MIRLAHHTLWHPLPDQCHETTPTHLPATPAVCLHFPPSRLGLDAEVVSAARARLDSSVADVNSAISALEASRAELDREEDALARVEDKAK